jgi:hypothetical protein
VSAAPAGTAERGWKAGSVKASAPQAPRSAEHDLRVLALFAVAVVGAATFVGWALVRRGGESGPAGVTAPKLVSAAELHRLAASLRHPVFWAGAANGMSYELTATPGGRVFVRYLPPSVEAGDTRAGFVTVGTYPSSHPYRDLERAASADDAVGIPLPGGGVALMSRRVPRSVYLARRGSPYQVEVYDPSLDTARDLVLSGAIQPVR